MIDPETVKLSDEEVEKLKEEFCVTPQNSDGKVKIINDVLFSKLVDVVYKKGVLKGMDVLFTTIKKEL